MSDGALSEMEIDALLAGAKMFENRLDVAHHAFNISIPYQTFYGPIGPNAFMTKMFFPKRLLLEYKTQPQR